MVLEGGNSKRGDSTSAHSKFALFAMVMKKAMETPRVQRELRSERNLSS